MEDKEWGGRWKGPLMPSCYGCLSLLPFNCLCSPLPTHVTGSRGAPVGGGRCHRPVALYIALQCNRLQLAPLSGSP